MIEKTKKFIDLHQDIIILLFNLLNEKDETALALTCMSLLILSKSDQLWKQRCKDARIPIDEISSGYRKAFFGYEFFSYGHNVTAYQVLNKDVTFRDNIPDVEILSSLPEQGMVMIYKDKNKAIELAQKNREDINDGEFSGVARASAPFIFTVNLKKAEIIKKITGETRPQNHFEVDRREITILNAQSQDFPGRPVINFAR